MWTRLLSDVPSRDLRPLLEEESQYWRDELLWDFSEVCAAVASGLDRRTLTGRVLQDGPRSLAYCYYMMDTGRAIVGSLFAGSAFRGQGLEEMLLEAVIADAQARPGNERVECQTLFSTAQDADRRFQRAGFASRPRRYLVRDLGKPLDIPGHDRSLRPLRRDDLAAAARIIHSSHQGSLDAALNLTYATVTSCRAFVETLVLRSGCGRFDPEASWIVDGAGVVLASHLSATNGHICQVSVTPEAQSRGLGTVLVTSALGAFRRQGLRTASLSVTVDNARAYALYTRLGFATRKVFAAHAWVRPPAKIELPA
jgi:ribosomal protein S18 acetylase RimI-like enzyme